MEALNDILFLISEGEKKEDEDGFEVEVPGEELEVFCAVIGSNLTLQCPY